MSEQLDIFGRLALVPGGPGLTETESAKADRRRELAHGRAKKSINQRFAEFHQANPHVLSELLRLATARLERGERRIGVKALWEELRESLIKLADDDLDRSHHGQYDSFKLNNDFTAIYARKLVELEKRLEGVIEMRRRKGE